jgi:hypothetical protein
MAENIRTDRAFDRSDHESRAASWQSRLRQVWLVVAVYLLATWFTNAHFMADTGGYVVSILAYEGVSEYVLENPGVRDYRTENPFWEFGHLFWRPLGLILFKIFEPLTSLVLGPDPVPNTVFLLISLSFAAGLISVILLHAIIRRITGRLWAANLGAVALIFSHGFLNFAQAGSSYIAGLALLIAGLYIPVKAEGEPSWRTATLAGLAFAGAVCMWFLYALAIPAAIAAPLFLYGFDARRRRLVMQAAAAFALALTISYVAVMACAGIRTPSDLRAWISASSHGVNTSGVTRVLFGLPRSMINMGNDGLMFKRYLLQDPFNPVTAFDILRLSLWKLALVYLSLGSVIISLFILPRGKRLLGLLMLSAVPLLAFAAMYDGGAVERYLPLYPFIFLSLAWAIGAGRMPRLLKAAPLAFIAAAIITNVSAMATVVLERRQQTIAARLESLLPRLKPESRVVTTHLQDELVNFQASFPFHPINRKGEYRIHPLLTLNTDQVAAWREDFASKAMDAWEKGGDVWVSMRALSRKPRPEWSWVEGDDRRVSWNDINGFFSQLETGEAAGGEDGFALLLRSGVNEQFLSRLGPQLQQVGATSDEASETRGGMK